ncbi:tetratricopeptide repeat-containing sensor histidine kinase [Hymenobacter metallilatus]|uniref:Tetratricopeptide repeat-containing sensor histidine kinase n=1 Tax=Hymenobacter metallilatus TaxID=2493666 RepID=A0A3R9NZY6_9BACT|nr:tetratricopeptide repeat-containing sensor histidine kinase [Hymenobacter metallilatus]RSK25246.1 tetratricopeptide repeat-containing sensor histidine kinase [Hymenobacter metallilatus]
MTRFLLGGLMLLLLLTGQLRGAAPAAPAPLRAAKAAASGVPPELSALSVQRTSQRRIDSLRALVAAHHTLDTIKIDYMTRLAWEIQQRDVRAGLPVLKEALRLAQQLNYRDYKAETMLDVADGYILVGDYEEAKHWLQRSEAEFTRIHNIGGQIRCVGRFAKIAAQQGQYATALSYYFRVSPRYDYGDTRRFYTSLQIQIGNVYRQIGELAIAEEYLQHALEVSLRYDYPDRLNLIYGELGEVRRQQRRWEEARQFYRQSMVISKKLNLAPEILRMEINLAEMDEQQGGYEAALARARPALPQAMRVLPLAVPRVLVLLARSSLRLSRPDSAVQFARQGLQVARAIRVPEGIRDAHEVLARAYAAQGRYAQAYQAQQLFMATRDSLSGAEVSRRTIALQYRNKLRQQKAKIQLLTQRTKLQEQERQLARLRQQWQVAVLVGVGLLLALLAVGGVWQYRRRQTAREAALRTSLAADLHDDVGSLLTQISLQSTMLREGLYPPEQQRGHLDHMAETSRMAARQMSDVVWGIDARNDSFISVLDRMRDHAHQVLPPAGLELDFFADPALLTVAVPLSTRQALYLIYKEALHNAVKHAQATLVTVRLQLLGRQLQLEVLDDGRGGPLPVRPAGQGLRNMQARAAAAAGTVSYDSLEQGFRVLARLPLG